MKEQVLQLALNELGEIVSIYDVTPGDDCNCYILNATGEKIKLIAKNNNKKPESILKPNQKIAHFARTDGQKINNSACESVIHLLAKEVLKEEENITIPPLYSTELNLDLINSQPISIKEVKTEKFDEVNYTFKPDAVVITKNTNQKLFIEFHNTHAVDHDKFEKIKKHGVSCIEIDIYDIPQLSSDGRPNKEEIKNRLHDTCFSKWIYNNKEMLLLEKKKSEIKENEIKAQNERVKKLKLEQELASKIEKEEKDWIDKIKTMGYELKQIYRFDKYNYDNDYNENTGHWKTYKSLEYRLKNVDCEKQQINGSNKRIETFECEQCEYFKGYHHQKLWEGNGFVACGFKNGLKNR